MEFNITTKDFKIYDDQIHLASNLDNSFFFHRYYGNYCDTAWFSGSYQTANRRFGGNYEKNIGLGIDYEESKVSWYLNGVLQYSDTLQGWSNNAKQNNEFDLYQTDFCIGSNFIMEAMERSDLCDLYEFYQKFKCNISCLEFNEDDYRKLLSRDYYPKNILDRGNTSYKLLDLLDLREDNKKIYGEFFGECINIIKSTLKDREERRNRTA